MRSQPTRPGSRWLLHSEAAFGIALPLPALNRRQFGCGCSSVVEHDLAKVGVEGSSPFARSKILQQARVCRPKLKRPAVGGLFAFRQHAARACPPRYGSALGHPFQAASNHVVTSPCVRPSRMPRCNDAARKNRLEKNDLKKFLLNSFGVPRLAARA